MTGVLIKREETQMYVWGRQNEEIWEEWHIKTESESGVTHLHVDEFH
jgi:hypothetical protein